MVLVKVPQPAERFLFLFCFVLFLSLLPSPSPSPNTCCDPHPRTYVRTFVQEMARAEAVMEQKGDVESTSSGTPTHDASTEDGTQPHHDDDVGDAVGIAQAHDHRVAAQQIPIDEEVRGPPRKCARPCRAGIPRLFPNTASLAG